MVSCLLGWCHTCLGVSPAWVTIDWVMVLLGWCLAYLGDVSSNSVSVLLVCCRACLGGVAAAWVVAIDWLYLLGCRRSFLAMVARLLISQRLIKWRLLEWCLCAHAWGGACFGGGSSPLG